MPSNLYHAIDNFSKSKPRVVKEYSGILGLPVSTKTVKVPNRNGYVYVRLRDNDSEIIQAYNDRVSPVFNLPVIVVRQGAGWRVKDRDIDRYNDWGSSAPFLPEHHFQHEFDRDVPGGDIVFVYPQQFIPMLVTPLSGSGGGSNVLMQLYNFKKANGSWLQAGVTGTQPLLPYKPSDDSARVAMVFLDRLSGNPGLLVNSGSSILSSTTGTHDLLQYLPSLPSSDYEPLAMVRLVSGTETIDWGNLYDIRQFFPGSVTGTGGGGGTPGGNDTEVQVNNAGSFAGYDWFRVDSSLESLIFGQGTPDIPSTRAFHIIGDGLSPRINLWSYGASNTGFIDFYSARGTKASPLPTQEGDSLGRGLRGFVRGTGSWPSNAPSVYIEGVASETATGTGKGAGWRVWITPRGSAPGSSTKTQGLLVDERGLTIPELTGTPLVPATGYTQIYPKTDGMYYHTDGDVEVGPLGLGSPSKVVVTNSSGTHITDEHFYYDYVNDVLILGDVGASQVVGFPALGNGTAHLIGSGTSPAFNLYAFGTSVAGFNAFFRARGDPTTPTAIQHGDVIGRVARFRGHNGAGWSNTQAEIKGQARGVWSTGSHGTEVVVGITPSGTTTMQDMLTVNQAGADLLHGTYNISGSPHSHVQYFSESYLPSAYNVSGSNSWQDTGLSVMLPIQGQYSLDANVRGILNVTVTTAGRVYYLVTRLYNQTSGAEITNSERLVVLTSLSAIFQMTCPIHIDGYSVSQASQIKLQALRDTSDTVATWASSQIGNSAAGRTSLSYRRIG